MASRLEKYIAWHAKGDEDMAQEMRIGAWTASKGKDVEGLQLFGAKCAKVNMIVKANAKKRTATEVCAFDEDMHTQGRWVDVLAEAC